MPQERKKLGYDHALPHYVHSTLNGQEALCEELIREADVMICGSAPEKYIRKKIRSGSPVFRYSERPLKNGLELYKYPVRFIRWRMRNPWGKPIYMLCASAFAAWDYSRLGLFRNRCYRWGYFPEVKKYSDLPGLLQGKDLGKILWVARLIPVKRPNLVIEVAKQLREKGYSFSLDMIGIGPMERALQEQIDAYSLTGQVNLLGAMKPEQVRVHMEKAGIFLFTSDKGEGWGAVVNEAMNSGCAVVASHAAGSVPYLLRNGENGLIFQSGSVEDACKQLTSLLDAPQKQLALGEKAYETVTGLWSPETAANRLYTMAEQILSGEICPLLYEDGPCSKAEKLKDDWF